MTIRTSHERRVERARALRRSLLADRVLVAAAIGSALWLAAFATATALTGASSDAGKAVGDVAFLVPELPIPLLALLAARRRADILRRFWLLLGVFAVLWVTADALWGAFDIADSGV